MIRKLWPGLVALFLAACFGAMSYGRLPERVASHWGIDGEVNGWMSRTAIVIFVPLLGVFIACVLAVAPRIDPKYRNFPLHASAYLLVANASLLLLAAVHVVVIGYNLGWPVNMSRVAGFGGGVLFVVIGNVLTRVRPNWIFGVRTPWSLSSERSWRESHRVGGYCFVAAGLLTIVAAILRPSAVAFVLNGGALATTVATVMWSYIAWKRDPLAQGASS